MTTAIPTDARVTFGGILRSEWIKLVTLRSTVWCYVILVVLTVGIGVLVAALVGASGDEEMLAPPTQEAAQSTWLMVSTVGAAVAQLVIAVLGVLTAEAKLAQAGASGEILTGNFGPHPIVRPLLRSSLKLVAPRSIAHSFIASATASATAPSSSAPRSIVCISAL